MGMKNKIVLFKKSIEAVWRSASSWALANIIISLLKSFLPLALIWLIKLLIDEITLVAGSGRAQLDNLLWLIIAAITIWLLDEILSDLGTFVRKKQSIKLESYMFGLLHDKAIKLDLQYFENPDYYDYLARASREAPWRPNSILNNLVSLFRGSVSLILMLGLLFTFHWAMALLLVVVNIPGVWLRLHFSELLYNFQREQTPESRKMAYFNWLLTGSRSSRELRLFDLGNYFEKLFRRAFENTKEEEVNLVRKRTLIDLVSGLFKATALFLVFFVIAKKTVDGSLSIGEMSMYILAFRQGMTYLKDVFGSLSGLYEDSIFVGDTFEFLDLEENIKAEEPIAKTISFNNKISLENVSFKYPGSSKNVIDNVSLEIKRGEVVAFVGPNGAGKSTLVRLLCRLYDTSEGKIKWDNVNIRNFEPAFYRENLSVIFQDFMLYNMSVEDNITMGDIRKKPDIDKMVESAKNAGLKQLIESLPNGYKTVIGTLFDDSRELSWGEWQKLALSRALYRDAPLLILDEPSSSLDANTEHEIFSRFREITKGRTAILISHRLKSLSSVDRIYVLDKGKIVESGSHEELLAIEGLYRTMYEKQTSRF